MNSELIIQSDLLDILFENRNKAYGAYALRRFYQNRLFKSVGIMTILVIVLSAITFLPDAANTPGYEVIEPEFGKVAADPKIPEVKPKPVKPATSSLHATVKFSNKIVVTNLVDSADKLQDLKDFMPGLVTNIAPDEPGLFLPVPSQAGSGFGPETKPTEPAIDLSEPVDKPDIMPGYPGGIEALRKFLQRNISNPREMESGELVSVKVKFVVGYDGKLQRFELIEDGGREFNEEVLRVLKKMPAWIPGKSKGQNVSVYYIIPVKFIGEG